jgi:hypothetical protein
VALAFLWLAGGADAGPLTDKGTQPPITYPIPNSGDCSLCHGDFDGSNHTEPWTTWAGSMMAQAARDPIFWAALDVANNDAPGAGDFCLRCHMPKGWLAGRSEPPGGSDDGCGMQGRIDEADNDFEGLSCEVCHRMMINPSPPPGEQSVYTENGNFWIDDAECTPFAFEPCRRGPYDYPADGVPPIHPWAFSSYHEEARFCGNCHNVTSPLETLIDENGTDTGIPFPIERTFKEWEQSDYEIAGTTCQNCHMPDSQENPIYACSFQDNNRTGDLPIHEFAGGNAWIPDVLRQEYVGLGLNQSFIATRDAALDLLQNQSALVELTLGAVTPGQPLAADVKITNLTGHKLPTGYPEGRRMWINVQARDGLNAVFWESGAYDDPTGVLTEDAQIKIYHTEHGIWNRHGTNECDIVDGSGNPAFHFVLGNCIAVDNRIPPVGFTGGNDPETQPVGIVYPEESPGVLVNYDVTSYSIPVPGGVTLPVTVEATVQYQTTSKEYVEFLVDQAVTNGFPNDCIERGSATPTQPAGFPTKTRAEILEDMWLAYGRSAPVEVGNDSASPSLDADGDGFLPPADCDDNDDTVFPGASELCDNKDNDCDTLTDEGNPEGGQSCNTGMPGICAAGTTDCQAGGNLACVQDQSAAPDDSVCNGLDDDCDGPVDEDFVSTPTACGVGACAATGQIECQGSVEIDTCAPGTPAPDDSVCDGIDNDCDGPVDEDFVPTPTACGVGGCAATGQVQCVGGTPQDSCTPGAPTAETCNGVDDDCDGSTDDGLGQTTCGIGACTHTVDNCVGGVPQVCDPFEGVITETCNGVDDDCDGTVDDGNPGGGGPCSSGLPGECDAGTIACENGSLRCVGGSPAAESCDGLDNDCNGTIDDGNPGGGAPCSTGQPGVCAAGTETCAGGSIACVPDTTAGSEICGNGLDDDCDGEVDDAASCGLDHFMGYKVRQSLTDGSTFPGTVTLTDPTWDGTGIYGKLKPKALLLPADKEGEGVSDSTTHLLSYQIRESSGQPKHARRKAVQVTNQFHDAGTPVLVDTVKADVLLVPTLKDLDNPVAEPDPQSHSVDHFKCYRVKPSRVDAGGTALPPFSAINRVWVVDQFENRFYDLRKPLHLCNAVDKNGEGLKNAMAHLLCYKAKKTGGQLKHTQRRNINVNTQLSAPLLLDSKKEDELCVPSDIVDLGVQ